MSTGLSLLAMHGWCGDQRSWTPWLPLWQARGWQWICGERGYGQQPPRQPSWPESDGRKVLIAHSLGPHLLPAELLAQADAVVLLTSFGRFVPSGRDGRKLQVALAGMAAQLAGPQPQAMLQTFLQQVAAPEPAELLQTTPALDVLPPAGLERLQHDLDLLAGSSGLPAGFPTAARVLLVQAGGDQIVAPAARQELEQALPQADVITLSQAGHALLRTPVIKLVDAWLEGLLQP
jgi:pimeloyl-[acyl-carrier protein] methyl ester esterase